MNALSKKFQPLIFSLIFISSVAILLHVIANYGYHFTYSISQSVPRGWYLITPAHNLSRGDMVQFIPPKTTREFLLTKHWVPQTGLLLKYLYGVPGDFVCNNNHAIWVNHKKIGPIFSSYAPGKSLPQNKFCGVLTGDHYLLLSTQVDRSFDGRYFGPIQRANIIGLAKRIN